MARLAVSVFRLLNIETAAAEEHPAPRKSIMSRLAKKPIQIPDKVEVTLGGANVTVRGPLATLSRALPSVVSVIAEGKELRVSPKNESLESRMLLGTTVAHLKNMIKGSVEPFVKKLIIEGIGFKADVKGQEIVLSLGFSHPVKVSIPQGLKVVNEKGVLTISGSDIESVGSFAAEIRALKKPEPYKGKGIRYDGEIIRRKQGKKTV